MSNTSKHDDSSTGAADEGRGYESPVRRKSTIKNKVTKLRSSTKSLFSRSKVRKEGSRVSGSSSVLEAGHFTIHLQILQKQDKQAEDEAQPRQVSEDTASIGGEVNSQELRQPDVEVLESPIMVLFVPLTDSDEETPLKSLSSVDNTFMVDSDNMEKATHEYEVVPICGAEIPTPEPSPKLDLTRQVSESNKSNRLKKDNDDVPTAPSPSDPPSYFSDGIPYYKFAMFALAAAGLCILAAPHTYRLLRMR